MSVETDGFGSPLFLPSEPPECVGGVCPDCGRKAEDLECAECGVHRWTLDCGHFTQPRPIAPGRGDGSEQEHLYCEDCALKPKGLRRT